MLTYVLRLIAFIFVDINDFKFLKPVTTVDVRKENVTRFPTWYAATGG